MKTHNRVLQRFISSAGAPVKTDVLQRRCACGGAPGPTGECSACRREHELGRSVATLQPSITRTVSRAVYRQKTGGGTTTTSTKCSAANQKKTEQMAEDAYKAVVPFLGPAEQAMTNLHSAWINDKADLLAGRKTLRGVPVCAFNSNFNTSQKDADYGVFQIRVMKRLAQLARKMKKQVGYVCATAKDKYCTSETDGDTEAYVLNGQPPIHFCPPFTSSFELMGRQSTVLHEYAHLLPGVGDKGGYAALGAHSMTCALNVKFSGKTKDLVNTADALAGFVMHIGQTNDTKVKVS